MKKSILSIGLALCAMVMVSCTSSDNAAKDSGKCDSEKVECADTNKAEANAEGTEEAKVDENATENKEGEAKADENKTEEAPADAAADQKTADQN